MLIKALCDYYDVLATKNIVLPDGFSKVGVHYLIGLSLEGDLDSIIDCQLETSVYDKKGKEKKSYQARDFIFPKRSEKTAIFSNIIEHRPNYIFGIQEEKGMLLADSQKVIKSHEAFVKTNLDFIEGMDSPLINAYRNFINKWNPHEQTDNPLLVNIAKVLSASNYAFCLSGHPEKMLQDEECIKTKWLEDYNKIGKVDAPTAQCAVSGEVTLIARIHSKIKGVVGGQSSGTTLVGYNNPSEESYGKTQSYNSNISENVMTKYCEALNYLLSSKKNRYVLDGVTFVFWANSANEKCDDWFNSIVFGSSEVMDKEETENMLLNLLMDAKEGRLVEERLKIDAIDPDVDFYIVGIKPNSSRLAIKLMYHKHYGEILRNNVQHQLDLMIIGQNKPLTLWQLRNELISSKSSKENIDPALLTKLLEAIIYNRPYPSGLLAKVVQRIKLDVDSDINSRRAGLIKACLNRQSRLLNKKEEIKMALDLENKNQAYLCGRLFACLERLQSEASGGNLNRSIKDAYFGAASTNPNVIFPKLIRLGDFHKKKLSNKGKMVWYDKLIGEIMDALEGQFPGVQNLDEQGKFIIGYYQQRQDFFKKKEDAEGNI